MCLLIAEKILTETLIKVKNNQSENGVDMETANLLFGTIAQLYKWNSFVKAPIRNIAGKPFYQSMHLNDSNFNGQYLILYSGMKYHKEIFGDGVGMLRMQDYISMYIECYTENHCNGIIIDPLSPEETILNNDCIGYILNELIHKETN